MDVCVTVPKHLWDLWQDEGDLPGWVWTGAVYHFWLAGGLPDIQVGERVYIVAHNRLRGYAPLVGVERSCRLRPRVGCLLRHGGAVACTIDRPIRGFRGWRERWWPRDQEIPFPKWREA